jgi:hypothetical protein
VLYTLLDVDLGLLASMLLPIETDRWLTALLLVALDGRVYGLLRRELIPLWTVAQTSLAQAPSSKLSSDSGESGSVLYTLLGLREVLQSFEISRT